jgi:hypothetical protein
MLRFGKLAVLVGFLALAATGASAATIEFKALPYDGAIAGVTGSTSGWGYEITNNSPYDLVLTNFWIVDALASGTPNVGLFDYPEVAAGQTVSLAYHYDSLLGLMVGLAEFTWDMGAAPGTVESSQFALDCAYYYENVDGVTVGVTPSVENGLPSTVYADFSVTTEEASPVPEPATMGLLALGLAAFGGRRLRANR